MPEPHSPEVDSVQDSAGAEPATDEAATVGQRWAEEYAIAAADPDIATTIEDLLHRPSNVPSSAPPARPLDKSPSKQFTLPMLIGLTLVTSIVFALMRTVSASVFAATLGLALALAPLAGMTRSQFGTMLWWTLLGVYSTAVVVLLVTG